MALAIVIAERREHTLTVRVGEQQDETEQWTSTPISLAMQSCQGLVAPAGSLLVARRLADQMLVDCAPAPCTYSC